MITDGRKLEAALSVIDPPLTESEKQETRENAAKVVARVVEAYKSIYGEGSLQGVGVKDGQGPAGLLYGRIQSGKTRAMVTSAALALDNGFQIVVVLTSNVNMLVGQTYDDFDMGLPEGATVYSRGDFGEVDQAKRIIKRERGGIVIVCSKGSKRLQQAIEFLGKIGAADVPALIFDDEGDQASLDTNVAARASKNPSVPVSRVCSLIHDNDVDSVRSVLKKHVFVSVTGTPQSLLLSNADSVHRPSFTELLKAGRDYTGGSYFFGTENPRDNELICLIDSDERDVLLEDGRTEAPEGLKHAVRFFLVAAAAASVKMGWPKGGYKFLCHPSHKTDGHVQAERAIKNYLNDVSDALDDSASKTMKDLRATYDEFAKGKNDTPPFDDIVAVLLDVIDRSRSIMINVKGKKAEEISYAPHLNFLIGGNTLGRGVAVKKLLVTYYVRESVRSHMDTMYQHARMFGYRKDTLPYTKVFLPPQLYTQFRDIYLSDEELRSYIEETQGKETTFPVRVAINTRPTRKMVLDSGNIDHLIPGKQAYPNLPFTTQPQAGQVREKVIKKLAEIFPDYETRGNTEDRTLIPTDVAIELVSLIKTNGTSKWHDKHMPDVLRDLKQQLGDGVYLHSRRALRDPKFATSDSDSGVLEGKIRTENATRDKPTLWVFDAALKGDEENRFIYPTLMVPSRAALLIFNRG